MTQQVLARKWRPTSFQDLVGQDHVRKALTHALTSQRLHHAYLFTGTRGVGKTTIARILARCLNCETGVTATPCGQCSTCVAISENRFVDLIEVDAASRTKVDDTRDLLENVSYAPTLGRYKIYLIDEVHMLTAHSFNALLKTLEEPPEHVVFLFATTDPHKLLPTVLSRCLQFHLRDLSTDQIQGHLHQVVTAEGITSDSEALWQLARAGRGSMRDAMTLLDQAIAFGQGAVVAADVVQMLGVQGLSEIPVLLRHVAEGNAHLALDCVHQLAMQTPDWLALVSGMQSVLHQVAVSQISGQTPTHLPPSEQRVIDELAALMAPEFLQLAYQFTLTGYRDLPMASDPRSAFEMLLLRMLAFRPARTSESVSAARLTDATGSNESTDPEPEPRTQPSSPNALNSETGESDPMQARRNPVSEAPEENTPIAQPTDRSLSEPATSGDCATPEPKPEPSVELKSVPDPVTAIADPQKSIREIEPAVSSVRTHVGIDAVVVSGDPEDDTSDTDEPTPVLSLDPSAWTIEAPLLGLHGMTGSLIMQSALVEASVARVVLALKESSARLLNDTHLRRISEAFALHLGGMPEIQLETRDNLPETPEAYLARMRQEAVKRAQVAFQEDPFVATLTRDLDAEVRIDTIQPRENQHV